ncbi:MAG: hypothetical protein IT175_11765 [Acidobacteria bacterium]|nr:hypothetical protein [Acidobacteriota bacterium]
MALRLPRSLRAIVRAFVLIPVVFTGCAAEPVWQSYTPSGGIVSVDMPGLPAIERESVDLGYGGAPVERAVCTVSGGEQFEVGSALLPGGRSPHSEDELFDRLVNGIARITKAKAGPKKAITLSGYSGVESEFDAPEIGRVTFRCYLVQGRVYRFVAIGQPGSRFDAHRARFFGSIAIAK